MKTVFRAIAYALVMEFMRIGEPLKMALFEPDDLGTHLGTDFRVKVTVEKIGMLKKEISWTVSTNMPVGIYEAN